MSKILLFLISLVFIVSCEKKDSATVSPDVIKTDISLEIKTLMSPYYTATISADFFNEALLKTQVDFGMLSKNSIVVKNVKVLNNPLLSNFPLNIQLIESDPKIFSISNNTCTNLAAGATCSFSLTATVPNSFYSGTKFVHVSLGKDDKGQSIGAEVYAQVNGDVLESYLTSTQGFSVTMNKNFTEDYSQESPQERFLTITNNSSTRYLRNSFSSSSFVGPNASDFIIKSNNCNFPIPPNKSCQLSVLYKTWKNNSQIPDVELKIPNLNQKISLKSGLLNLYEGTYSNWSVCSAESVCSGQGTRVQNLQTCIKNGTESVDLSNCVPQIVEGCFSPAGSRTISISNGSLTQSCQANSTSWENQAITCSLNYHNFNFECIPDAYLSTYSSYANNAVTAVCSGTQKAYRDILTCTRIHDNLSVATTLCHDSTPFISYYSPEGTRNVSIANGSRAEKCSQGADSWRTTSVSCNPNFHQSGDNCIGDTYIPTEFTPYEQNVVTAVCSGTQTAHRSISKCIKSHNYEVVSNSLCIDPTPTAIYQSPFGSEVVVYTWGLQFIKCETGATVWDVSSVSCAQYYSINPADTKVCIANNVADPIATLDEAAGKNNPLEFTVIGDNNTNKVDVFSENSCSTKIGSAVKGQGIWDVSLSLNLNTTNPIFVQSSNTVTSKKSGCVFVKNYKHDNTPPTGSINIEGGVLRSTKKLLTINTVASDVGSTVKAMKISEGSSCQGGSYIPYATTTQVDPTAKKGEVYYSVKFIDEVDNESPCYSARIIYELIPSMASSAATNWNEYFLKSDSTQLCTGLETGSDAINTPCIHGGEKRKIVLDQTSCLDLSMTDSLSMFIWRCEVEMGKATFTSTLAPRARLQTMIEYSASDSSVKWKKVNVTLRESGVDIIQSEDFTWLSNPLIQITPAANTISVLNSSGAVYVINGAPNSGGLSITADQIAIINLEGSYTTFSNTAANCDYNNNGTIETGEKCGIFAKDKKFLYIEGTMYGESNVSHTLVFNGSKYVFVNFFSAINGKTGLNFNSANFNKVVGLNSINMQLEPIKLTSTLYSLFYFINASNSLTSSNVYLTASNGNVFSNFKIGNSLLDGIQLVGSASNKFSQMSVSSAQRKGINIDSASNSNRFNDLVVSGNTTGIDNAGTTNTFVSLNLINNSSTAFNILSSSKQNIASNLMLLNNRGSGIKIDNSLYNVFSNLYILNQETITGNAGIYYNGTSLYNKILGSLLIPSTSSIPCVSTSNSNGINNLCASQLFSGFSFSNSVMSLLGIFKQSTATSLYSAALFSDSYASSSKYLTGFIKSVDFSNNANSGYCGFSGGICVEQEFALSYTDQTLLKMLPNIVPTPPTNPAPSSEIFVGSGNCPNAVRGTEIFDDGVCVSSSSPYGINSSLTIKANCVASGNVWASLQNTTIGQVGASSAINYLKNAREITDPYNSFYGDGNHNGLCESGESCIYTPNVGVYQGYGELKSCVYNSNGGLVTGVKMYGYESNGE